jgi:hypothetical protein
MNSKELSAGALALMFLAGANSLATAQSRGVEVILEACLLNTDQLTEAPGAAAPRAEADNHDGEFSSEDLVAESQPVAPRTRYSPQLLNARAAAQTHQDDMAMLLVTACANGDAALEDYLRSNREAVLKKLRTMSDTPPAQFSVDQLQ